MIPSYARELLFVAAVLSAQPGRAEQASPAARGPEQQPATIRAETNLVLLRFHVTSAGAFVDTLAAADVRVTENGKLQEVVLFEGPQSTRRTVPIEITLLLDVSRSVINRGLLDAALIESSMLRHLDSESRIGIFAFAARLRRFCEPTRDPSVLERALGEAYRSVAGETRLYRAIEESCRAVAAGASPARLALVVFSDGFETGQVELDRAIEAALVHDVRVYPVVLGHRRILERARRGREARRDRAYWQEREMEEFAALGERTGGRSFDPPVLDSEIAGAILRAVALEVRSEYLVGYHTVIAPAAAKRKARVALADRGSGKLRGGEKEFVR